jgi:superfamily II DNA helicase RecQ
MDQYEEKLSTYSLPVARLSEKSCVDDSIKQFLGNNVIRNCVRKFYCYKRTKKLYLKSEECVLILESHNNSPRYLVSSPEVLNTPGARKLIGTIPIDFILLDECHTAVTWLVMFYLFSL